MDIGSELRQAREGVGLSLHELSNRTKIRLAVLRAIESNDFGQLPNDVFTRGFIKLYAREVGLDPVAIAGRFDALFETDALDGSGRGPALSGDRRADAGPTVRPVRVGLFAVLLAALLVAGYVGVTRWRRGGTATRDVGAPPEGAPIASPVPAPAQVTAPPEPGRTVADARPAPAAAEPAAAARTDPAVLQVALHATGPCWLAATADGKQVAYRLLNADERLAIEVSTDAVLRIGSPGNLAVTINGRPIRPFERPGQPVTLRITPENFRELTP
jgi:cytoskeletal protein RodZ